MGKHNLIPMQSTVKKASCKKSDLVSGERYTVLMDWKIQRGKNVDSF